MPAGRVGLLLPDAGGSVGKSFSNVSITHHFTLLYMVSLYSKLKRKLKLYSFSDVKYFLLNSFHWIRFKNDTFRYKFCKMLNVELLNIYISINEVLVTFGRSDVFRTELKRNLIFWDITPYALVNMNVSEELAVFIYEAQKHKDLLVLLGS